ncbi:Pholip_ATPase_N domain-containing protein, partial [Haematococcus lacustris]
MNRSTAHVVQQDGSVKDVCWSRVQVGQVLLVRDNEALPADLLCMASGLEEGVAFVRT